MSADFSQISAVFDRLLKAQFVTSEEARQAEEQFRLCFLTLPHRDGFIAWLERYLREMEANDEFTPDRVSYFRAELESLYDRVPTHFSMYHITGLTDPRDRERSLVLSDALDDSFAMPAPGRELLMGPTVPERLRPTVARVLQLLAARRERQRAGSVQWLSRWRLLGVLRLGDEAQQRAAALLTVQKHAQRVLLRGFGALRAVLPSTASPRAIEELRQEVVQMRRVHETASAAAQAELAAVKSELEQERTLPPTPRFPSSEGGLLAQLRESRAQTALLEEQLGEARDEAAAWRDRLLAAEQRLVVIAKGIDTRRSTSAANISLLSADEGPSLSLLSKMRYLDKTLQPLLQRLKAAALFRLGRGVRRPQPGIGDATDRLKARMLLGLRNAICGQDLRKSFLRWMVKADPGLMHSAATKLAVNARINPHVAIWRLRYLQTQAVQPRLLQLVRGARQTRGLEALAQQIRHRQLSDLRAVINRIEPRCVDSCRAAVGRVWRLLGDRYELFSAEALQSMRNHKKREHALMTALKIQFDLKARRVLQILRRASEGRRETARRRSAAQLLWSVHKIFYREKAHFFSKLAGCGDSSVTFLATRLTLCWREKYLRAITLLVHWKREGRGLELQKRRGTVKAFQIAEGMEKRSAIHALQRHAKNERKKRNKVTIAFKSASGSALLVLAAAFFRLRSARQLSQTTDAKRIFFARRIERIIRGKLWDAVDRLKAFNNRLATKSRRKKYFFERILRESRSAQRQALLQFKAWAAEDKHKNTLQTIESERRGQEKLKKLVHRLLQSKPQALLAVAGRLQRNRHEEGMRERALGHLGDKFSLTLRKNQLHVLKRLQEHRSLQQKAAKVLCGRFRLLQTDVGLKLLHRLRQGASRRTKATRHFFSVAVRTGMRTALQTLRLHRLHQLAQKSVTHLVLERLRHATKGKETEAARQLRMRWVSQELRRRLAAALLRQTLEGATVVQIRAHFGRVHQNAQLRGGTLAAVIKAMVGRHRIGRGAVLEKLRASNNIRMCAKRHVAVGALTRLVRSTQRKVIERLRGTAVKNRVHRLSNLVAALFLRRQRPGFNAIRRTWHIDRYRNAVRALERLLDRVRELERATLKDAWAALITAHAEQNPWFRRTINIWVLLSKTSAQNSFWRLRYGRNMKQHALSAEATLRLKKLIFLVQKEVQRDLNFGFWKLHSAVALRRVALEQL